VKRFHVLVGLLLSSQTKDPITAGAVRRLQSTVGLTPASIRAQEESVLAELIKPVGFYRMKAGYLKKISNILGEPENKDDIPDTFEELIKLPGIGPKMVKRGF
jgi:endonuclease III